jgi:hypothetical protein
MGNTKQYRIFRVISWISGKGRRNFELMFALPPSLEVEVPKKAGSEGAKITGKPVPNAAGPVFSLSPQVS